ncbi:hypothetical protein JTE90_010682 [Oedothorax gibbosus]|uniref:Uncharacterized protein n=1 Tax=Oedothorax gibbosus TaxID=931172 RepID=A0AAV6UT11_9ARAC|nr:hypothetical protein JTE90_010682 [Oedothorax gibbosus]
MRLLPSWGQFVFAILSLSNRVIFPGGKQERVQQIFRMFRENIEQKSSGCQDPICLCLEESSDAVKGTSRWPRDKLIGGLGYHLVGAVT